MRRMLSLVLIICASCGSGGDGGGGDGDRSDASGPGGGGPDASEPLPEGQVYEGFDVDPEWEGHNNRVTGPRTIVQSFGFSPGTSNAGGNQGEVGGQITPCGEPAYYARSITARDLTQPLAASGRLRVAGGGNTLLGFFNDATVDDWRTANSVVLRLYGRGTYFNAYPEYATSHWKAGSGYFAGDFQFPIDSVYNWTLTYDPAGNAGNGTITATLQPTGGGETITTTTDLPPEHKADGATFTRFGLLNVVKSADDPGSVFIDEVNINGQVENFDADPGWTGSNNSATYESNNVRFNFDFGHSAGTSFAGGKAPGEMGGQFFRGDSREAARLAFYGDPLDSTFSFDTPLHAEGVVSFRRGVTDSTVHIGFFHDTGSVRVSSDQAISTPENFLGATIEGPSSDGFYFYPSYGSDAEGSGSGGNRGDGAPAIYPDDVSHEWELDYDPQGNGGTGQITVTLDGQQGIMNLDPNHRASGATFTRFGCITPHIDGNGQTVYFDDLIYSHSQPAP